MRDGLLAILLACVVTMPAEGGTDSLLTAQREQFGEQLFQPVGGFILQAHQVLPPLVWTDPDLVASLTADPTIRTLWFDASLAPVERAAGPGRYFAYGEATGPGGTAFRRGMTCVVPGDADLEAMARSRSAANADSVLNAWRFTEEGAVELAALLEADGKPEPRVGQWAMESATRHVRLKRKVMGRDDVPPVEVRARRIDGQPAPVLRAGSLEEAGVTAEQVTAVTAILDDWYEQAGLPTAIVIARNGVTVLSKAYGELDGAPVTVDTPMLLHSAMKPLMGVQLGMYVDRGLVGLDDRIGDHLPDFNTPDDQALTFLAGHVHASGIRFPWPLAFSRLFYFRTWQESLIAHRHREWPAGDRHRYGVVGIILSVRALELMSGMNYWDAMEREVFAPLGIRNILPGGTGFSAENLARFGVMLANKGRYGEWELLSEATHASLLPTNLQPYFPKIDKVYGVGFRPYGDLMGPDAYGHAGGCGTQIVVNPENGVVFAMVRNERGEDYKPKVAEVLGAMKAWGGK